MERISWKFEGLFKGDAEKCYAEVESLDEATPEKVLALAEDESTELHKCIEWDIPTAARKYQLSQESNLKCIYHSDKGKKMENTKYQ